MKVLPALALILLFTAALAHARGYEAHKTVEGYDVVIRIDKNPPVLGDNQIEVEIKDASGKVVKDAEVFSCMNEMWLLVRVAPAWTAAGFQA